MKDIAAGKLFRRILRTIPAALCSVLCSCASLTTWRSLGREAFVWKPSGLSVSVKTERGKDFLEKRSLLVVKKGEALRYYVPYDFAELFPLREKSTRTEEYEIEGNLPLIPVREVPGAKDISFFTDDAPLPQFSDRDLNCSFAGLPGSVKTADVSPEDLARLKKPFLFRHYGEWYLCVPGKEIKSEDMLLIPAARFGLGPDDLRESRKQETLQQGPWITFWRIFWLPLPVVIDAATFPVQLLVLIISRN